MAKKSNDIKIKKSENKGADIVYYRLLVGLGVLIAVVFGISLSTRTAEAANSFSLTTVTVLAIIFGVLSLAALVYFVFSRIRNRDEKKSVLSSSYILILILWLTSIFAFYNSMSQRRLTAYIIATAVLYFVYYLFKREFFAFSLYCVLGAAVLVVMSTAGTMVSIACAVFALAISVAAILIALADRKAPLTLKIGSSKVAVTNGSFKVYPFCIAAGILLAGAILSLFAMGTEFYSLIVLFVYYLVFTVINTVNMM